MPSNHSHPLLTFLLLPSIFPSIRVFSNESALCIRWPKYWRVSFSISPSREYSGLLSFRINRFDLLRNILNWKECLHILFPASLRNCRIETPVHFRKKMPLLISSCKQFYLLWSCYNFARIYRMKKAHIVNVSVKWSWRSQGAWGCLNCIVRHSDFLIISMCVCLKQNFQILYLFNLKACFIVLFLA